MSDPKEPSNSNDNTVSDWEGADEIEQDLQDKIRTDMEKQEPKIENEELNQVLTEMEVHGPKTANLRLDIVEVRDNLSEDERKSLTEACRVINELVYNRLWELKKASKDKTE